MLSVREAASSLTERFIGTLRDAPLLEVSVFELRRHQLKHEFRRVQARTRALEAELEALREKAINALRDTRASLERDIALMAFVDALESCGVRSLDDVGRMAAAIISRANSAAGFDVLEHLPKGAASGPRPDSEEDLDIPNLRRLMSEGIRSRLTRLPLSAFDTIGRLLDDQALLYSMRRRYEQLDALTLRASAEWDPRLREAAHLFVDGRIELIEVARLVGAPIAEVAASFERLEYARPLSTIRLTEEQRINLAAKLSSRRGGGEELIAREVIASQRIEGIDARAHLEAPAA